MISYAQNFEDVMLWRALKHVERGFYIDIGAQDPVVDSVSLGFYEQGWRGVHVEPTPAYAQALRDARPDETVVQAAIGRENELIPFFEIAGTGISTGDAAIAHRHEAAGYANKRIDVPCIRLSSLLDNYQGRDIHWMKIDVEGMELSVLRSWAPSTVRPWIVVLESTLPLSQELSHGSWEEIVLGQGYRFAYFDGLNRFYVSEQHEELLEAFVTPPNVFDGFALAGTGSHSFCAELNKAVAQARSEVERLEAQQTDLAEHLEPHANGNVARFTRLERRVQEQAAAAEQRTQEVLTHSRHLEQALKELEQTRVERLELVRHLGAKDNAHTTQVSFMQQESAQLRQSLAEREKFIVEVRLQLVAAQTSASRMQAELLRHEEELERMHVAFRETRDRETRLLALQEQLDQSRAADAARHLEERTSLAASHNERERAWSLQSASLEAGLREQLDAERSFSSQLQHAFNEVRTELDRADSSVLSRLTRFGRKPRALYSDPPSLRARYLGATGPNAIHMPAASDSTSVPRQLPSPAVDARATPSLEQHDMKQPQDRTGACATIDELLSRYDEAFVVSAYQTLLGREPDPGGLKNYLGHVRNGVSKTRIVAELACSNEGKAKGFDVPGLQELVARDPRKSSSIWTRTFGRAAKIPGEATRRQLRIVDNRLYAVEQGIARQSKHLAEMADMLRLGSFRPTSAIGSDVAVAARAREVSQPHVAPRVARIYSDLMTAIAFKTS